jgi:hypothetical protein
MFKRKMICAIVLLSLVFGVTCSSIPVSAANYKSIGVSPGVVTMYNANITSSTITKIGVYFQSVFGTNATILITSYIASGAELGSSSKSGNISLYTLDFNQNLMSYVVAANLTTGDLVCSGSPWKFNSTSDMTVAGTTRNVVNLNYNITGHRTDFYYDRATGINVKATINVGGANWQNITLISTNAWSSAPSSSTSTMMLAVVGIGALVVGLAIGLVMGRRKKGK